MRVVLKNGLYSAHMRNLFCDAENINKGASTVKIEVAFILWSPIEFVTEWFLLFALFLKSKQIVSKSQ